MGDIANFDATAAQMRVRVDATVSNRVNSITLQQYFENLENSNLSIGLVASSIRAQFQFEDIRRPDLKEQIIGLIAFVNQELKSIEAAIQTHGAENVDDEKLNALKKRLKKLEEFRSEVFQICLENNFNLE